MGDEGGTLCPMNHALHSYEFEVNPIKLPHPTHGFLVNPIYTHTTPSQEGGTEFKRQSVKYTAQKLFEKGVLEIEGLPNHQ